MNQNLLHIVARHNVERIYGDGRFDWIDDTWADAVVTEGARLAGRGPDHDHGGSGSKTKMAAMAARTRERRTG